MSETGVPRRLHPAFLVSRSVQLLPQMLAGGAGYAAVIQREGLGRILFFAAVAAVLGAIGAFIWWWRFRYTIEAGEIVIERGLFHRQRRVIPFDRVQDIAIERPLLARLLGTARVKIETGGSTSDEGRLDMIGLADAVTLRDRIRRWHDSAPATLGGIEAVPAAEPLLFHMTVPRILFAGLFNFSLVFLAVIFAAFQYLDDFNLFRIEDWLTPEGAETASAYFSIRASLFLVGLLLTLGILAGVARTVAREYDFRLARAEAGFRRRRGLLTLQEAVIPLHRVQVGVIDSGVVSGRLGWHSLSLQTLGADQKEGGVQAVAPFASLAEVGPLLAEARLPSPPDRDGFRHLPRRALLGWAAPWLLLSGAAATIAFIVDPLAGFAAAALLVASVIALLRWRKHGWALGDEALVVRDGLLSRRVWIIPFAKAQSISVYQGPLQRRLSLATLLVDTAGASFFKVPDIADMDAAEARALAATLLDRFHQRRLIARSRSAPSARAPSGSFG